MTDIPPVSRGTEPLGPQINTPAAAKQPESRRSVPAAAQGTDAAPALPQTNPRIGMGTTTVVPTPPPAAQPETTPPATRNDAGQVWVGGHYSWVGGQWTWVDGTWQRPPNPNAAWIPGNYDAQSRRWTEGHWATEAAASRSERR